MNSNKSYYFKIQERNIFVKISFANIENKELVVFFNPLFDEKRRVQNFQAETTSLLTSNGYAVLRFDYYATGDSNGLLYMFNIDQAINDAYEIITSIKKKYGFNDVSVIGLRFGCFFAGRLAGIKIKKYLFVDPVINGKKYLQLLYLKKDMMFKNLNIKNTCRTLINKKLYEDLLGYPLSVEVKDYIQNACPEKIQIYNAQIKILITGQQETKKSINKLCGHFKENNDLTINYQECEDFYNSLETINTMPVSGKILDLLKE